MRLRIFGFSGNSSLKGTIAALDDNEEPLGWELAGDWSRAGTQKAGIKGLVANIGISEAKATALIAQALKQARTQAGIPAPGPAPVAPHTLPAICVTGRQGRDVKADIWRVIEAVNRNEPLFFGLGSSIVHLEHGAEGPYLHTLSLPGLRDHLGRLADFISIGEDGGEHAAKPPRDILEDMLALAQPPLPRLQGIVRTPVLTADWAVLSSDGYHAPLALYLDLEGVAIPQVRDNPTASDVAHARAILLGELLVDFPFATKADRAHAVGALLTPIVRPAIKGPTPLFLIEAPMPGTGKGLLDHIIALIATGGQPAVMTEARDEDEWRKRITAKLKQGPALVLIDNIRRPLRSAALSAALTELVWEDRELGASKMVRLPVRCTWLATANNPALSGEIARRVVRIRIDAGMECPWERNGFRHDPLEAWAQEHRGDLLCALLTLIKGWLAAGRPPAQARMGSYQEWANMVGGILAAAGILGFLENRQEVYALAAAELEGWRAFVEVWGRTYDEQRVGVDKLFDLAREHKLLTELRGGRSEHGARVAMGIELANMRDRLIGQWVIRSVGAGGGVLHYRLEKKRGEEKDPQHPQDPPPPQSERGSEDSGSRGSSGSFPTPTLTTEKNAHTPGEGEVQDACRECGGETFYYAQDGTPYCSAHGPGLAGEEPCP